MKTPPTYTEIANDYSLWMEYVDTAGLDTKDKFNSKSEEEKINIIKSCFGD